MLDKFHYISDLFDLDFPCPEYHLLQALFTGITRLDWVTMVLIRKLKATATTATTTTATATSLPYNYKRK